MDPESPEGHEGMDTDAVPSLVNGGTTESTTAQVQKPSSASLPPLSSDTADTPESATVSEQGARGSAARFKVRNRPPVQLIRNMHANYFTRHQQIPETERADDSVALKALQSLRRNIFASGSLIMVLDYMTDKVTTDLDRYATETDELLERHTSALEAYRDENLLKKNILLETVGKEVQDAATLAIETLRQMTPTSLFPPSVSREQLSPCTLPIPITSVLGLFTTMRHLQYISRNMQRLSRVMFTEYVQGIVEKTSPHYHRGENKFDVGEFVQSLGDLVSADASLKGVEFVIYHSEYDLNHVPIKGSEESWRHALINLIKSIIDSAKPGSTVELCLIIFAVPQTEKDNDKVVVSFEITYHPNRSSTSTEDDLAQLNALLASKLVRAMGGELEIEQLEDRGKKFIVSVEVELSHSSSDEKAGTLKAIDEQPRTVHPLDTLKFEGAASLAAGQEHLQRLENMQTSHPIHESQQFFQQHIKNPILATSPSPSSPPPRRTGSMATSSPKVSAEPTVAELMKFSRKLNGLKIVFMAKEHSAFAVRLTGYLKAWGINVSRKMIVEGSSIPLDTDSADVLSSEEPQTPAGAKRTNSSTSLNGRAQPGTPGKEASSPTAKSLGNPAFIMIDDDIKTLSQQILKLQQSSQPPTPGNPRRPTHRRHKSLSSIQHTSIIYFTSLPTFKQARDTIMFVLGTQMPGIAYSITHTMTSGTPQGPLPYILVLPKPAGPRRVLTAIHTAINVPILDQSYSPIATAPTSPAPLMRHFSEEINPLDRDQIVYDPISHQAFARTVPHSSQSSPGGVSPNNVVLQDQRHGRDIMRQLIDAGKNSGTIAYPFDLTKEILSPETPGSTHTIGSPTGVLISGSGNQIAGIQFDPTARPSGTISPSPTGPNSRRISNGSTGRSLNSDGGVVIVPPSVGPSSHQSFTIAQPYRSYDVQGASTVQTGIARMNGQFLRPGGSRSPLGTPPTITQSSAIVFSPPAARHNGMSSPLPQRPEPAVMRSNNNSISSGSKANSTGSLNSHKSLDSPKAAHPTLPQGSLSSPLPSSPGALTRLSPSATGTTPVLAVSPQSSEASSVGHTRSAGALTRKPNADAKATPTLIKSGVVERVSPLVNVLIVEDNKINQTILVKFMKQRKIKYEVACNGREAVDKWKVGGFHLVLMDIQMPVMDGIEATREIRRLEKAQKIGVFPTDRPVSRPTEGPLGSPSALLSSAALTISASPPASPFRSPVIIVALTATEDTEESRNTALLAGCNDYITKPIGFAWLERKIVDWGCMQALIDVDAWKEWKKGLDGTSPGSAGTGSTGLLGSASQAMSLSKTIANAGAATRANLKRPSISARSIKGNKAAAAAAVAANKSLMAANAAAALAASISNTSEPPPK
ncbi:ssk1 response regulator receiver [Gryganskiella cystojenkinii]|nr:ssk1 response regulator receiver [Gryganskiella cystojenkinii]